jgi:2-keto-4-pentenoate hydratase/2-oxohepta-3-ene-1,7-dioic acid hydratase in catechol pathway
MTRWVRFLQEGQSVWGQLHGALIQVYAGSPLSRLPCGPQAGIERLPLEDTPLLAPCEPTKIVCVGRNYRAHAAELGHDVPKTPLFFLKPPSALLAPGGTIRLPKLSQQVEHEGEIGVVMRRRCSRLRPGEDLRRYVLGFTCVNDVTARDLQNRDPQWTRAKGFDTFCPVGPCVAEPGAGELALPFGSGIEVETRVNGERRQRGTSSDFLFSLEELLCAITEVMTLEPGDLVATGTPAGVGPLQPGDRVSVEIGMVGRLENGVARAPEA